MTAPNPQQATGPQFPHYPQQEMATAKQASVLMKMIKTVGRRMMARPRSPGRKGLIHSGTVRIGKRKPKFY